RVAGWVAAGAALAVLGGVALWQLTPIGGGRDGKAADPSAQGPAGQSPSPGASGQVPGGQAPSGQGSAAPSAAAQSPAGPPVFIKQTAPNPDDYNPILKQCHNPVVEEPALANFQTSVTTAESDYLKELQPGRVRIGFRLKYEVADAPPYYVAVAVKPQHEVDAGGRSTEATDNRQLGFVARARDLYEGDETQWKYALYPDDFSMELDGKRVPAPPLAQDPGGWTVVFRHAVSDTQHKSVVCDGFDSGPQKG
ncbi:hypothetical protein HYE82_28610, partial [Streptomyces sp. BR123]|nr:hypothetical protein [Streptomyces sp. BR123]